MASAWRTSSLIGRRCPARHAPSSVPAAPTSAARAGGGSAVAGHGTHCSLLGGFAGTCPANVTPAWNAAAGAVRHSAAACFPGRLLPGTRRGAGRVW